MTKFLSLFLLLHSFGLISMAQQPGIKGILQDAADKSPVAGATVVISLHSDSVHKSIKSTVTDAKGNFELLDIASESYIIEISFIGYQQLKRRVVVKDFLNNLGSLTFTKQGKDLSDVTILSTAPPVSLKGDTIQYSANQFKVNPDATTEDLIKKMPGITVAKDGTVTAHGEQVKKVTIDGKDFFGDDASAALKNIPAEVVDKIQVFDRLSDQAQLTGFDDGNSVKAINVVTRSGIKNSQFGRMYAG